MNIIIISSSRIITYKDLLYLPGLDGNGAYTADFEFDRLAIIIIIIIIGLIISVVIIITITITIMIVIASQSLNYLFICSIAQPFNHDD